MEVDMFSGYDLSNEINWCEWEQIEDGNDWSTSCGDLFTLLDGKPSDNDMKFCCYCGKKMKEKIYNPTFDD
jgi:hypothetical protein